MSYTPTQWKAGDTVTSAKLNKMEQGIANAGGANILIAHIIQTAQESDNEGSSGPILKSTSTSTPSVPTARLDKTAKEILDADFTFVITDSQDEMAAHRYFMFITNILQNLETGESQFVVPNGIGSTVFYAVTEDDYPETLSDDETSSDDSGNTPIVE